MDNSRVLAGFWSALVALVFASIGCNSESGGCPSVCTGGCPQEGTCTVDCAGTKACEGKDITCPSGYSCHVICDGIDACDTNVIQCPVGQPCNVTCEGRDGCGDVRVKCGDAGCAMACGESSEACTGAVMECGAGPCQATCAGSEPPTLLGCEKASLCSGCVPDSQDVTGQTDVADDIQDATEAPQDVQTADKVSGDAHQDDADAHQIDALEVVPDLCPETTCPATNKGTCAMIGSAAICTCDNGFRHDADGNCVAAPSFAELQQKVLQYKEAHPGKSGDILSKSEAELAEDPEAKELLALCGPDERPIYPLLAWEYGGFDHAWQNPEQASLLYCVFIPVAPNGEHWSYDAEADHVMADLYLPFPAQNPCAVETGRAQVAACVGAFSNFEIIVDTASLHDGHDVGLELSESSTDLRLVPPDGGPAIFLVHND